MAADDRINLNRKLARPARGTTRPGAARGRYCKANAAERFAAAAALAARREATDGDIGPLSPAVRRFAGECGALFARRIERGRTILSELIGVVEMPAVSSEAA